jgi:hypothetical protein
VVPWRNVPGRNVLWIFRPRNFVMQRPWDKTVLGTKQSLDKTSSANLRQNVPIFRDGLSVPENKTWHNFFGQNVPDPLLLPWQPGPGSADRRRGTGGAEPAARNRRFVGGRFVRVPYFVAWDSHIDMRRLSRPFPQPIPLYAGLVPFALVGSAALLWRENCGEGDKQYFKFSPPYYKWRFCRQYITSQVEDM